MKITCSSKAALITNAIFLVIFSCFAAYIYFNFFPEEIDFQRDWPVWVGFGLIGGGGVLIFLFGTLRALAHWKKFGETTLEIPTGSGTIGGELRGVVRTSRELSPNTEYLFILKCTEIIREKRGKQTYSKAFLRWSAEERVRPVGYRSTLGVPVCFKIPTTCLAVGDNRATGSVVWELIMKAPCPGLDFEASFSVLVFSADALDEDEDYEESEDAVDEPRATST